MRLVLDTDVLVASLRSPMGASAELLRAARSGSIVALVSVPLLIEYEGTCLLAEHRIVAGLTSDEVTSFLDAVAAIAEPVDAHYRWRPQLRDPGDEMVLETAVNGGGRAIVTFNRRDFGTAPARFGINLWTPAQTLQRMRR